jgi:ABC-type dipeptide/oligopeptide/nickel transport system ATPase subunit
VSDETTTALDVSTQAVILPRMDRLRTGDNIAALCLGHVPNVQAYRRMEDRPLTDNALSALTVRDDLLRIAYPVMSWLACPTG